jgi:hypothetical protein
MKATLERHTAAEPSKYHYEAAAKGLKQLGIKITADEIPRAHHVQDLAIWVDTVRWCSGDGLARNALLDRMLAKEARLIVDAEVRSRENLAANDVPIDEATAYMNALKAPADE